MIIKWLRAIIGVGSIAGFLKALLLPLAFLYGRWTAFKAQWEINQELAEKYREIEERPLTDEDIDNRLDAGSI
jgi:hypothetical protein